MNRDTPWNTAKRFSPDESLLGNASMAKKLVDEHQLNDSNLKGGLQEFVDSVGRQAYAAADVVNATTEGEELKAQDRRELNQVEAEDRRSLIEDIAMESRAASYVRKQSIRGLVNEGRTLDLANQSHEDALRLVEVGLEVQRQKTDEAIASITQRVEEPKTNARNSAAERLNALRKNTKALSYQKVTEGNGAIVDARVGFPSNMLNPSEEEGE